MPPLEGVEIGSPEQAAPFATRQLANLGACVVKTERPESLGLARSYVKPTDGRARWSLALELTARAGVFVQNLAPEAAGRLGCAGGEVPAAAEPWSGQPS